MSFQICRVLIFITFICSYSHSWSYQYLEQKEKNNKISLMYETTLKFLLDFEKVIEILKKDVVERNEESLVPKMQAWKNALSINQERLSSLESKLNLIRTKDDKFAARLALKTIITQAVQIYTNIEIIGIAQNPNKVITLNRKSNLLGRVTFIDIMTVVNNQYREYISEDQQRKFDEYLNLNARSHFKENAKEIYQGLMRITERKEIVLKALDVLDKIDSKLNIEGFNYEQEKVMELDDSDREVLSEYRRTFNNFGMLSEIEVNEKYIDTTNFNEEDNQIVDSLKTEKGKSYEKLLNIILFDFGYPSDYSL